MGHDAAAAAKDVANAPAAKELGSDIKQGTEEAAAKTKVESRQGRRRAEVQRQGRHTPPRPNSALNKAKDDVSKK